MYNALKIRFLTFTSIVLTILFTFVLSFSNMSPASAFVGTLENGNMAYAEGSGFDKGEACDYLPGFTADIYDAWHFVLTNRGAVFQQDPTNPKVAINLNFVFMKQDGSTFVLKSGAWVQTGKGVYTYTLKSDKIRMVQLGTVAKINVIDSGMRLSHTCPGTGSATTSTPTTSTAPTPTPTPTASSSPSPTTTRSATPTTSVSPTNSTSRSPSASPSVTPSNTPSASSTPSATRSATPSPSRSASPSARASAIQPHSTRSPSPSGSPFPRNPIPTPSTSTQPIGNSPSPSASPSSSPTRSPSPTPTQSTPPSTSPTPSVEPSNAPPVVPTPPPVEDPKNVIYVDPQTPTTITPQEPPASPIIITKQPEYGKVDVNPNGTVTYTPAVEQPKNPVVDVVVFQYTNLSGATVIVRKEFVVTRGGDVPSIIQTGYENSGSNFSLLFITLLFTLTTLGLVRRKINE